MASDRSNADAVVLRNTTRWLVAGIYGLISAAGAFSVVHNYGNVGRMVLFVVPTISFAVLSIRGASSAISIDPDGVTAQADRFTRYLRWSEIDKFALGASKFGPGVGLRAWRHDGSWVRLMDHGIDTKNRYEAAVRTLERELALHQSS